MTERHRDAALAHRRACESTTCPCFREAHDAAAAGADCFAHVLTLIDLGYRVQLRVVGEVEAVFVVGVGLDESFIIEGGHAELAVWLGDLVARAR